MNKKHTLRWLVVAIALVTAGAIVGPAVAASIAETPWGTQGAAGFCNPQHSTEKRDAFSCPTGYKGGLLGKNGKEVGPKENGGKRWCCFKKDASKSGTKQCASAKNDHTSCQKRAALRGCNEKYDAKYCSCDSDKWTVYAYCE